MPGLFGSDATSIAPAAASWLGGKPKEPPVPRRSDSNPDSPSVEWAKRVNSTLKRQRMSVTKEMKRNVALARGETPWWRNRESWKISTKLNYCATIPFAWAATLCDAKPNVSYSTLDRKKQKRADIASAAWNQAYKDGGWEKTIREAVLTARVQKKAYLRLTYDGEAKLTSVLGEQVWMDEQARHARDAEILLYEYRESYGSLCERYKKQNLRARLKEKYAEHNQSGKSSSDVFSGPQVSTMPDGTSYNVPAYSATENPPDGATGSSGVLVSEYWTRPHRTVKVEEVLFLANGEPATEPKLYDTIDPDDAEPLRRVVTEGGVIYELPESIVTAMIDAQDADGIRVISDVPCLQVITHKVSYPLYPDGRLLVIIDSDIDIDDRMNPLGYTPFAEINANADPGGGQYGLSDVDLIADPYELLIRTVSTVGDTALLSGNSIWRIWDGDERSDDEITNAPGAIFRESLNSLKFAKREPASELPQYIIPHIRWLVEQIKDLSGLSDMVTGKIPAKTQVSTETTTLHQEASGVRFRDALADLGDCVQTLGEQFIELMARFYTAPVIVAVKNEAGVEEPTPMLASYLTEPFVVEAKSGSKQTSGPSARLNTLLNIKNAGVPIDLETIYDLLEELGSISSASATMRRIEQLKMDPRQNWKLLGLPVPGQKPKQQAKKPGSRQSKQQAAAG